MVKVIVYSTVTCPWCVRAKDFFKKHKIPFIDKDVAADQAAAQEMIGKSGQMGVPVIDVNGTIMVGFDEMKLKQLLKIN